MQGGKSLDPTETGGPEHLVICRIRTTEHDILTQGALKEIDILLDEAYASPQVDRIVLADISAINQNAPLIGAV